MTSPTDPMNDEFEAKLRQLLKAEADTVTTSPEALNLIRERAERRRGSAWFGLPWLRPAVAVAGAALIAASVLMSTPQVREQVLDIVPAGADREGTPPEAEVETEDPAEPAVPAQPLPPPQQEHVEEPTESPSPSAEASAPAEDPSAKPSCPPKEDASASPEGAPEDCEPDEEPSTGTGGENTGDSGGSEGSEGSGDSGGSEGSGGGDTGGSADGGAAPEGTTPRATAEQ
ncbi:hypothetical protein [Nocardiopsis algeriensis]|uniref:Putative membrane protein YgcG n=1 Tax=Nocardiopsis algeriensis TaxID=1478215 RepID=A0A841ITL3_9ACTN|nr:hypothetical protein [Nocardiopsis algeriensis]MBB6121993.1 putative membrane protein YgcG [Nocardiopsis algeriensis]